MQLRHFHSNTPAVTTSLVLMSARLTEIIEIIINGIDSIQWVWTIP